MALSWNDFSSGTIVPVQPAVDPNQAIYDLIDRVSGEYGVDPKLIRSMVKQESGFNPKAVSPAGAQGLMQLMPPTAGEMGLKDPFDPEQNIRAGVGYYKKMLDAQGGDQARALAAYNFGPGNVAKGLEWPKETRDYIAAVTGSGGGDAMLHNVTKQPSVSWDDFTPPKPPPVLPDFDPTSASIGNFVEHDQVGKMIVDSAKGSLTPAAPVGELPLGLKHVSDNPIVRSAMDAIVGIPEAGAALASGALSFPMGQVGGLTALPRDEKSLAKAFDIAEGVNQVGMSQPKTSAGQVMLKPIEAVFGTFLGTVDKLARDSAPAGYTEEQLVDRSKAWQYVANSAIVMIPGAGWGAKRAMRAMRRGKMQATPKVLEAAKAEVLADPSVPPTVKQHVASTPLDKIAEQINKGQASARVEKTGGPQVKFEGNADVVKGLLVEAELREGRGKVAMRKAAKIVAEHEGDISTADLKGIKGIDPKGSTGKAIARLVAEREEAKKMAEGTGEVPEFEAPSPEVSKAVVDDLVSKGVPEAEAKKVVEEVSVQPPVAPVSSRPLVGVRSSKPKVEMADPIKIAAEVDPQIEAHPEQSLGLNWWTDKETGSTFATKSLDPVEVKAKLEEIRNGYKSKATESEVVSDVVDYVKSEESIISEFDNIGFAKEEGYTFPSKRTYSTPEEAATVATLKGEGYEVVKVGEKWRVGRYVEEAPRGEYVPEVGDSGEARRVFELAKEEEKRKAAEGSEVDELYSDGVTAEDWKVLEEITKGVNLDEVRLGEEVVAEVKAAKEAVPPEAKGQPVDSATAAQKFLEWRDSYVTKCNIEDSIPVKGKKKGAKKPITKEALPLVDDKFAIFDNLPDAEAFRDAKGSSQEIIRDPSTGKYFLEPELDLLDKGDMWDLGDKEYLEETYSRDGGLGDDVIDYGDSGGRGRDLWEVMNNEGGFIVMPSLAKLFEKFRERFKPTLRDFVDKDFFVWSSKDLRTNPDIKTVPGFKKLRKLDDSYVIVADEYIHVPGTDTLTGTLNAINHPDFEKFDVSFRNTIEIEGRDYLRIISEEYLEGLVTKEEAQAAKDFIHSGGVPSKKSRSLWDILNNERGSVDVTPLYGAVETIENIVKMAKKMGKSVDEYLDSMGVDQASIDLFKASLANLGQMKQEIRDKDPLNAQIFIPEGPFAAPQRVRKNKNGQVVHTMPRVTQEWGDKLVAAPKSTLHGKTTSHVDPSTGRYKTTVTTHGWQRALNSFKNPIYPLEGAGLSKIKHMERKAEALAKSQRGEWSEWVQDLKSQIPAERKANYAIASYERMKGVPESFEAMGIKKSEPLSPGEIRVKTEIASKLDEILSRINYVRVRTGRKAIPRLKDLDGNVNYLPLIRAANVLSELGLSDGLTTMSLDKINKISKNFNGIYNPHAKKRNVSDIPIELDPFNALEVYGKTAFREINLSPIAALVKEMGTTKMTISGQKHKMSLLEFNPQLGKFLVNYSDQILGKDPVLSALMAKNEWVGKSLYGADSIGARLIAAIIGGSLRTFVVQPSNYLPATLGYLNSTSAGYGIARFIGDIGKGKESRYWKESTIAPLREFGNDYAYIQELLDRGFIKGARAKAVEMSMMPTSWMDQIVAEMSWNAGMWYGEKHLKLKGEDLINFADDFVEKSQGLPSKGSVSPVQASAATRVITILQSFAISDFNFIATEILGIKNPNVNRAETVKRVVKYATATLLVGEMYKAMGITNVVPDPIGAFMEAKEKGKSDTSALYFGALEFLEKVPVLGNIKFGSNLGGPVAELGDLLPEAAKAVGTLSDWGNLSERQKMNNIMLMARAIGYVEGIPMTNQILKSIKAKYNGGNPYEVIMGVYKEAPKSGSGSGRRRGRSSSR